MISSLSYSSRKVVLLIAVFWLFPVAEELAAADFSHSGSPRQITAEGTSWAPWFPRRVVCSVRRLVRLDAQEIGKHAAFLG